MRSPRDTAIVWTVALIVAISVMVAIAFVVAPPAGAHRVVSGGWAQRSANSYVHDHYCGGSGWTCQSVWVPVVKCGMHSYCWHGASHREHVCVPFWGCIWHRVRSSSGTVNGHSGKVTGYGEW